MQTAKAQPGPDVPNHEATLAAEPKVKVMIHEQEGHEGQKDVFLGVNGRGILVKRGFEVDIPFSYYMVLKEAKYEIPVKADDGTDEIKIIPRFAFNVIGTLPTMEA